MKISLQWLKDYVEVSQSPAEIADRLTHAGLEVENINEWRPAFSGVIVGELESFQTNAPRNHLSTCVVNGGERRYSVVCGAPNLKSKSRVALALEGAILPGGTRIAQTKIQGILSEGMLCSEKELGLSEDNSGILFLDDSLPLGIPLESALPLEDWIFDISITPNRSDCLSMLGMAREVAALTGQNLRYPIEKRRPDSGTNGKHQTSITIERPDLCPRYVGQLIFNVKIGPSPFWMRRRLQTAGVRSISSIVDITNYVMLEMGQPLHAFDFDLLEEKRIVVRTAKSSEPFTTLDGIPRSLPEEALLICDGKKPVALAGIMGGLNSEVQFETRNIFLESAYFSPMGIRRTSKRVGLSTEASLRFERGIDPNGCLRAANRAAALMAEFTEGALPGECLDYYPRTIEPLKISLRTPRVNRILGTNITQLEIQSYLKSLDLKVHPESSASLQVTVPTFRVDLHREIDLIEEVARMHGYHRIPGSLPSGRISPEKRTPIQTAAEKARNLLMAMGFWEIITYSFISPKQIQDLRFSSEDKRSKALRIHNPLSEDQSIMRTTLIPGLMQVARTNIHRQNNDLKLFELGRAFFPQKEQELPLEIELLSGILTGLREEGSWTNSKEECDFFDLKGVLENLLQGLGIMEYHFLPEGQEPFLHPRKACRIEMNGITLGVMGEVYPDLSEVFEIKQKIFLFELEFIKVMNHIAERRNFKPLPRFPAVTRDLAIIVENKTSVGDLLLTLWYENKGLIRDIKIFDLYQGKPIPPGKKSLAFHIKYQGEDRTLTDEEVNDFHQKLIRLLIEQHRAVLR